MALSGPAVEGRPTGGGQPRVSVVIPAYNAESTLGAAISSALTQTAPPHEIIVVDDGSTDRTQAVARAYGAGVRVVAQPNRGLSAARNAGASAATGDFLAFLDSDDLFLPGYLDTAMGALLKAGGGRRAVATNAYFLRNEGLSATRFVLAGIPPRASSQRLAILQGNFAPVFMVFPRDLYLELGGCDETLRVVEDWDLWLRAIYSGAEVVVQTRPQALYRWRPGSMSSNTERMLEGEEIILRRVPERFDLNDAERRYLEARFAVGSPRRLRADADAALAQGDVAGARRLYHEAARLSPRDLKLRARSASMRFPLAGSVWRMRMKGSQRTL